MYVIISQSKSKFFMEGITDLSKRGLYEAVDQLTEKSPFFFLRARELRSFVQNTQELLKSEMNNQFWYEMC
jgi:hypothetical protein